jgi:hypothetical protein
LTWPDNVSATKEALETLQAQVETFQHDVNEIAERAVLRTSFP